MDADLNDRLDAIDAKLDYIVERQRYTEGFIRDMTPVGREALTVLAARMAEWEKRGWFTLGSEMVSLFDRIADSYGPDDVQALSDSIVQILDTVRNVTQPDVLAFANEATDVLHHTEDVKPVGPLGVMSAASDTEVQRGLGVALELLRHLGRARDGASKPVREAPRPSTPAPAEKPLPCPPSEIIVWENRRFTPDGFLLDTIKWDEELAVKMATGLGIELTDAHWVVLRWARHDYLETGASPNVRRMASGSGVGTKQMYELFPRTPGKSAAMIAGIPKPVGCV